MVGKARDRSFGRERPLGWQFFGDIYIRFRRRTGLNTVECGLERLGITYGLIVVLLLKHQTGLRIDTIPYHLRRNIRG
jgi:hypothetical protein